MSGKPTITQNPMQSSQKNYEIPNFAYPFKEIQNEQKYYESLVNENHGNYLFSKTGFWHGGIHFNDTLTTFNATDGIRAIADGQLVAYRINDEYMQNDDKNAKKGEGFYSNGFFLLKHKLEYPKGNILTFFSLYMHMAKKELYFSKITGNGRNIRVGYSNSSNTIKEHPAEFDKDINIITDGKWDKKTNRTKVLYVEGLNIDLSQTPTIHKSNVEKINEVEYFEAIGEIFKQNVSNEVKVLETPLQIKAGEVIGLVGENNINHGIKREVLHLEVFVSDKKKLSDFIETVRTNYNTQNTNKPKPTQIKIPRGKTIYDIKNQSVVQSSDGTATIKDSNNVAVSQAPLTNGTKIEVDTSKTILSNRYSLLKIDTNDVSSNNWNIYKGSVGNLQIVQSTNTTQPQDTILTMSKVKTITLDNKKYLYINEEQTKAVLYSECQEIHPITFEWATIIDESSSDDISIFTNLHKYLLPDIEDYKQEVLKVSSMYEKLFKEIDTSGNNQIEAQELEEATKNEAIKKITSKFIVKHSSEWDKKINLPNSIKTILEKHKKNIKNYDKVKQHLENEEKRAENLAFFEECKSVSGFPKTDNVFHINPIGLIGVFGQTCTCLSMDKFQQIFPNALEEKRKETLEVFNKYCQAFEINTPLRVAHFFAQVKVEVGDALIGKEESTWYKNTALTAKFGRYFNTYPAEADQLGYKNKKTATEYAALSAQEQVQYIKYGSKYYTQLAQPDEIAKRIYCCSGSDEYFTLKQGGDQSGLDYKGKGFIQLTWKGNYREVNDILNTKVPNENVDIVTNPYSVLETKIGMLSAMGFWEWKKLNDKADGSGADDEVVDSITDIVNYYTTSRNKRKEKFQSIKQVLGI